MIGNPIGFDVGGVTDTVATYPIPDRNVTTWSGFVVLPQDADAEQTAFLTQWTASHG